MGGPVLRFRSLGKALCLELCFEQLRFPVRSLAKLLIKKTAFAHISSPEFSLNPEWGLQKLLN